MQHAYSAAASVEQFAKDVILPGMQAARTASITMDMSGSGSESSEQDSEDQGHKVFVATLLALREILAMNASRIFGIEEHCRKGEDTCSSASGSGNGNSRISTKQNRVKNPSANAAYVTVVEQTFLPYARDKIIL